MSEALTREIEELRLLMGSPRDPHGRVFAQLGNALRRAGSHREALTILLDGVAEHPNFSPGHLVLGWTAQESGDFTVARTAFQRTLELDPENPNGLFGLGRLLDREGDPRGADLIEEAESLDAQVRVVAPPVAEDAQRTEAAPDGGGPPLERLPFLSLEEMAPDMTQDEAEPPAPDAEDEALFGLPFISLQELAPDGEESGESESTLIEAEAAEAPGVGSAEVVEGEGPEDSGSSLDALPFLSLEELRPEPEPEVEGEPAAGRGLAATAPGYDDQEDEDIDLAGPLATRTMGELLVRQGLTVQAIEVFETLVERAPEDVGLRDRLDELRGGRSGAAEATADFDGELDGPEEAEEDVEAQGGEEAEMEIALAADLHESAAHPSMDPPVPHPEVPSPFHLGAGEGEEGSEDEGEGVGDYFSRLLGWSPGGAGDPSEAGGPPEGEESDPS